MHHSVLAVLAVTVVLTPLLLLLGSGLVSGTLHLMIRAVRSLHRLHHARARRTRPKPRGRTAVKHNSR